jgi:hypothetical protein
LLIAADTAMNSTVTLPHQRPATKPLTADDIYWEPSPLTPTTDTPFVEAVLDAEVYRTMLQEALQALAALTVQHRRLTDVCYRLREELRERRR